MKEVKASVIGSGFGGLALAIRLQAAGFQTTIFEKRDLPGGRAYMFQDKGFTFDMGPTVITAPHCLEELFECAGKEMSDYVELRNVMPFYRLLWDNGKRLDYSNNDEELEKEIRKFSHDDWYGYKRFLEYSKEVFHAGYDGLVDTPFLHFSQMIKAGPQLVKLSAYRSVYSMVSKYVKDEHLRQAFSFHSLLVGGNPFSSSAIYTLIHYLEKNWGISFPKGGTHALVRALVQLFEELGGRIEYKAEVDQVISDNGKVSAVRLKDGRHFECSIAASNADVAHTYKDLLSETSEVARTRRKTLNASYSMSLFLMYFGTDNTYNNLSHHNVLFGPRYRELLKDIFKRGKLADDFSLYLHVPTVTDKTLAPAGCSTFYALSPVPHLGKAKIDWKTEGPKYKRKIYEYLESKYMPNLRKHIVTERIFTPEDFKSELNAHLGNAFSMEPLLTQSAYFRTHNKDKNVKGLYFVGAGTHPGAGVPGVVNSAKATFRVLCKDYPNVIPKERRDVVEDAVFTETSRPPEATL